LVIVKIGDRMVYAWKVKFLKTLRGNALWRNWRIRRGGDVGNYKRLPDYIQTYAPGHSFVDIGCMWGVNGEYAFLAEEFGSTIVKGVDVFGPTPEFDAKKHARNSSVEFILGDASMPETINRVGVMDVVFCAGVLYHHPSPFDLLVALRRMCGQTLILRTSTIPEIEGLPNGAVYFPMLNARERQLWNLKSLGVPRQVGITDGFEPRAGYGNWFWGLSPSCLESLLKTAGFQINHRAPEAFAQTVVCSPVAVPFEHHLPDKFEALTMGRAVSASGVASPA
jgi:2-polyprenyl-3-methyl-5-hydroxy-6-metoxy-1,4-benzoquinol methylase